MDVLEMSSSRSLGNDTDRNRSSGEKPSSDESIMDNPSTSSSTNGNDGSMQEITRSKEEFASQQSVDMSKRFEYLLKQTELYGHFMKPAYSIAFEGASKGLEASSTKQKSTKTTGSQDKVVSNQYNADIASPIVFNCSPLFIKFGTMRDYQVRGLNWLISLHANGLSGILADEMGLGKTLQTISLLGYLRNCLQISGPHLIIAPKSTLNNWMKEIKQWCPSLKAVCLIGQQEERDEFKKKEFHGKRWNVCVTSYEMVLRERLLLSKITWYYIIIDEAQRIKNDKSKLSENVRRFRSSSRLLLTGTPLQNDLHELWALLNFLLPDIFSSSEDFDSWFNMNNCFGDQTLVDRLHSVLRPFLLRRIKSEVEKSLLPKKEIKIYVPLTAMQREWYQKILLNDHYIVSSDGKHGPTVAALQNTIMQLRKVCNHPYLFPGAEKRPYSDATIPLHSGKLVLLEKFIPKLKEEGSRILLFCTMTKMLDILEDYCIWRHYDYYRLDGNTEHEVRQESIDEFNSPNSKAFIFLLSTRAGGLGINLASADTVILYDSDYNPQVDLQAMDRCHRIGQKKQVRVFRLVTENTVEEKIIERAEVKLKLDRLVIQEGRLVNPNTKKETKQELLSIIKLSAENIMKMEENSDVYEDLDAILARSKIRSEKLTGQLEAMTETDLRNFSVEQTNPVAVDTLQATNAFQFEGKDYRQLRQKRKQNYFEIEPSEGRKRKEPFNRANSEYNHKSDEEVDESSSQSSVDSSYDLQPKKMKVSYTPKPKSILDHYFAPLGVWEFYRSELDYYRNQSCYEVPIQNNLLPDEAKLIRDAEQLRIEKAVRLSFMAEREKAIMMQEALQWTKVDFKSFLTALEKFGCNNMDLICKELPGKSVEDVIKYSQVFWQRCDELFDFEKIMTRLNCTDLILKKRGESQRILEAKLSRFKDHNDFQLEYSPASYKGNQFSLIQDYNLLKALHDVKFTTANVFHVLSDLIKKSSHFDYFLRSRTSQELHSRCNVLMHLIRNEGVSSQSLLVDRKENIKVKEIGDTTKSLSTSMLFAVKPNSVLKQHVVGTTLHTPQSEKKEKSVNGEKRFFKNKSTPIHSSELKENAKV